MKYPIKQVITLLLFFSLITLFICYSSGTFDSIKKKAIKPVRQRSHTSITPKNNVVKEAVTKQEKEEVKPIKTINQQEEEFEFEISYDTSTNSNEILTDSQRMMMSSSKSIIVPTFKLDLKDWSSKKTTIRKPKNKLCQVQNQESSSNLK